MPRAQKFTNSHCPGVVLHALHWDEAQGPIVVLLHGGGANLVSMDQYAQRLGRSRRTVALDLYAVARRETTLLIGLRTTTEDYERFRPAFETAVALTRFAATR